MTNRPSGSRNSAARAAGTASPSRRVRKKRPGTRTGPPPANGLGGSSASGRIPVAQGIPDLLEALLDGLLGLLVAELPDQEQRLEQQALGAGQLAPARHHQPQVEQQQGLRRLVAGVPRGRQPLAEGGVRRG